MKNLVKWLLVPSVVLLGLAFVATPNAEARRWARRYYGYGYYRAPAAAYYAPARPAVHVDAPGVSVYVRPPAVGVYRYGPRVVVPPRIITPWFQMW